MSKQKRLHSFKGELLMAFIGIGAVPFVLCCVLLIQIFKVQADRDSEKAQTEMSEAVVERLDDMMESLEMLSERIAGNVKLSQALVMEDEE